MKRVLDVRLNLVVLMTIWLAIMGVPTLRLLLVQQATNARSGNDSPPFSMFKGFLPTSVDWDERAHNLAAQFPNDPQVQVDAEYKRLSRESNSLPSPSSARNGDWDFGQAYAHVYKRFPREKWLLDQALQFSLSSLLQQRSEELQNQKTDGVLISTAQVQLLMELARQGQNLQSHNGFYDLCEASALYAQNRDDEALQTLRKASRKKFDDGTIQSLRAKMRFNEAHSILLTEDRMALAASQLFSSYSTFRTAGYLAISQAQKSEARGNIDEALRIYSDVAHLGAKMCDANGATLILPLMGVALQNYAWRRGQQTSLKNVSNDGEQNAERGASAARAFATYASTRRPDLAREALQEEKQNALLRRQVQAFSQKNLMFGVPSQTFDSIMRWKQIGAVLLSQIQFLSVAWLLLSGVVWVLNRAGWKNEPKRSVVWLTLMNGTISVASLTLLWNVFKNDNVFLGEGNPSSKLFESFLMLSVVVLPLLSSVVFLAFGTWNRGRKARVQSLPAIPQQHAVQSDVSLLKRDVTPMFLRLSPFVVGAFVVYVILSLVANMSTWMNDATQLGDVEKPLVIVLALVVGALLWWHKIAQTSPRLPRVEITALFWSLRTALGALIIMSSAAYLLSSLVVLPLRHEADARLDKIMREGELVLIRRQTL